MGIINNISSLKSDRDSAQFEANRLANMPVQPDLFDQDALLGASLPARVIAFAAKATTSIGVSVSEGAAPVISGLVEGTKSSLKLSIEHAVESRRSDASMVRIFARLGKSAILSPRGASKFLLLPVDDEGTPIQVDRAFRPSALPDDRLTFTEEIGLGLKRLGHALDRKAQNMALKSVNKR